MADLASLCAHGFSSEEAAIALERSDSVTAALVLLLQRLTPEPVVLAEADLASSGQHEALEDEAVALGAIFDDAFCLEALPGGVRCLRLQLPELQPVAGELRLLVPPGCAYPSQPCLPLFVPSAADGSLDAPGVRIALAAALAQQAGRLAADSSPACYELSTWLDEGLPGFLAQRPDRLVAPDLAGHHRCCSRPSSRRSSSTAGTSVRGTKQPRRPPPTSSATASGRPRRTA